MIGSNDDEMFAKWEERGKLQLKNYLQWHTKRPAQIGGDHASIKLTAGALDVPPPDNTILSAVAAASSATASSSPASSSPAPTSSTVSSSDASNAIALAGSRMFAAVTGDATPAVSAAHARGSIARRAGAAAADEANPNADPESSATEPAASEPAAAAAAALAGSRMFAAITGDAGANADADADADAPEDSGDAAADASTLGDAGGKLFASMV
jgi:hypothetical protein